MTDTPIGQIGNLTLIIRDRDGDGEFDGAVDGTQADAFGLSTSDGRLNFDETRVRTALRQVGIRELQPGARLQRIGAYMDMVREAERALEDGDAAYAAQQLEQAQRYAHEQNIGIDIPRFGDLRWTAVFLAYAREAPGLSELKHSDLMTLEGDENLESRQFSAQRILEYAETWAEIRRVEAASGFWREDLCERARELRAEIGGRAQRLRETGDTVERIFPIEPLPPPRERPPLQPPSRFDRILSRVRGVLGDLLAAVRP